MGAIYNQGGWKAFILALLAVIWEVYARLLDNPLLFPTFTATIQAFVDGIVGGGLLGKAWTSIKVLLAAVSFFAPAP